jgi:hypothetical protein
MKKGTIGNPNRSATKRNAPPMTKITESAVRSSLTDTTVHVLGWPGTRFRTS